MEFIMVKYQLIDLSGKPEAFETIDAKVCAAFGVAPDAVDFYAGWLPAIEFALSQGKDWDGIRAAVSPLRVRMFPDLPRVIGWLQERYTPKAWVE
jgi:hypothetical protein